MLNKNDADGTVQLRVVGLSAIEQLGRVDDQTVSRWRRQLESDPVASQVEALQQICSHAPVRGLAEQVVPLAGSRDDTVRVWAAQALESAVEPLPDDVPALMSCLQDDSDGEYSYWAATLLGRLGTGAVAATQSLCDCLQDSLCLPARERAAWALMEIGPDAAAAIPVLENVSKRGPARLRKIAVTALERVGNRKGNAGKFAA